MDPTTLAIFQTVARELSITRAAALLGRVQSNVTTRIQQLEQALGATLFIRDGKRLHLSEQGVVFLHYSERLLALGDEARQALHPATPQGVLRLGSMESTAASRLPVPLAAFHRAQRGVELRVSTGPSQPLLEQVAAGELDCALLAFSADDAASPEHVLPAYRLAGEPAWAETLQVVLPRGYTLGDAPALSLATFAAGCSYRSLALAWLARQGQVARVQQVGSYHAMLACAAAGQSLCVVPQAVLAGYPGAEAVSVVDSLPATTWLVWRSGYRAAAFAALRETLRSTYSAATFSG